MLPLNILIALRYLFGKKSTQAINIITGISILGISVGTMALILIMSVLNGFEQMMTKYLDAFNADLRIEHIEEKFFAPQNTIITKLKTSPNVENISLSIEEVAIFDYNQNQSIGIIKGVDSAFSAVTGFDSVIISGNLDIYDNEFDFASVGLGIANKLNININDIDKRIKVFMIKRNTSNSPFESEFKTRLIYPSSIFSLRNENDQKYIISNLKFAQNLLQLRNKVSSIDIKLRSNRDIENDQKEIQNIIGSRFKVLNKYQQEESFLKILQIEKWFVFIILSFIMLLIMFNVIGSLWMIVLEKKKDLSVLQAMGLTKPKIKTIFYTKGALIATIGFSVGLIISLVLYYVQKQYGIIYAGGPLYKIPYPIHMKLTDVSTVLILVLILGLLASVPAAQRSANITPFVRIE